MAHRPPISLPRTTVSPAVLEELIGEIGSLASVYHKPTETFVGKGRMGAVKKNILEYVFFLLPLPVRNPIIPLSRPIVPLFIIHPNH